MSRPARGRAWIVAMLLSAGICAAPAAAQPTGAEDRQITELSGGVYLVRDGVRYTVFLVTPDGIAVADPLSTPTATWLKEQLDARFPGRPVRFVLHTHHHFDRAEGGGVFERAQRIAHRDFNDELSKSRRALPGFVDASDRNADGAFDAGELERSPLRTLIFAKDRDGNGRVTADELYRLIPDVRRTYDRVLDVELGQQTVELIHPGPAHAADMTVLFFPAARLVFAADPPPVAAVPFQFGAWPPSAVFEWIRTVARLDFDTLVFGDGTTLAKPQLTVLATYLEGLRVEVATAQERGVPLSEVQARRPPSPGPHTGARDAQIRAIAAGVHVTRVVLSGSGIAAYGARDPVFCESFTTCSTGGAVPAGTAGLSVSTGRLGVGVELQMGAQSWHARTSPLYDDDFAVRESRVAVLARYAVPRRGLGFAAVGGLSSTVGDTQGMSREKAALAPRGGRHPLAAHASRIGITAGADVSRPLGSRFAVVVPIRFTRYVGQDHPLWPGKTALSIGGGLSMRVASRF